MEFAPCPVCKQKLGIQGYVLTGTELVCANPRCGTSIRIDTRRPLKLSIVPIEQTYNADSRPESYG